MNKKSIDIEYALELIVLVRYNEMYSYYISPKELWILNQRAWGQSFFEAGFDDEMLDDYSDRFDIPIVNMDTAKEFLSNMEEFRISSSELGRLLLKKESELGLDECVQYFPALYVDFDKKKLISYFPEPFPFEKYVPEGWTADYSDFSDSIPENLRYWIIGERDYLTEIIALFGIRGTQYLIPDKEIIVVYAWSETILNRKLSHEKLDRNLKSNK